MLISHVCTIENDKVKDVKYIENLWWCAYVVQVFSVTLVCTLANFMTIVFEGLEDNFISSSEGESFDPVCGARIIKKVVTELSRFEKGC